MKDFKFFSIKDYQEVRFVPVMTHDTNTTYHIPLDLYGNILRVGFDLYTENMSLFSPVEFNITNEIGEQVTYYYKITDVYQFSYNPVRIRIKYSIKFPDTEYYCNFITTERISLHDGV